MLLSTRENNTQEMTWKYILYYYFYHTGGWYYRFIYTYDSHTSHSSLLTEAKKKKTKTMCIIEKKKGKTTWNLSIIACLERIFNSFRREISRLDTWFQFKHYFLFLCPCIDNFILSSRLNLSFFVALQIWICHHVTDLRNWYIEFKD